MVRPSAMDHMWKESWICASLVQLPEACIVVKLRLDDQLLCKQESYYFRPHFSIFDAVATINGCPVTDVRLEKGK